MSDIKLDLDPVSASLNDLLIVNGDLVIVDGAQAILQSILQRLRMYLGEWFMDNSIGLPWFDQILVKNPDQSKIDGLIQNQILSTPGVDTLTAYSIVKADFTTRVLEISFEVQTTSGTVNYEGLI